MSQVPPPIPAPSDGDQAQGTDRSVGASLESLILAHHAAVYRYAYRLTGSAHDAEDLAQQAFLIAQQKLHQLREWERAAGWLLAIVRTTYLKSQAKCSPILVDGSLSDTPSPIPEIKEVDSEELQQALGELPPELRTTVTMFYFEELSYQEIASALEMPIGTVMSRLSRAKGRLRERLCKDVRPTASRRPLASTSAIPLSSRSSPAAP